MSGVEDVEIAVAASRHALEVAIWLCRDDQAQARMAAGEMLRRLPALLEHLGAPGAAAYVARAGRLLP